ncbi:MAG TPA: hypothetical protein DIW47_02075 [Bacteroidetes bacterium]|nr:hypothetical protein [Bacteroidota bacterium]
MEENKNTVSRKKILVWGAAALASLSVFPFLTFRALKKEEPAAKEEETIKMLTEDGKLVEINKNMLAQTPTGTKISHDELLTWVKK